ncbi:MAG: hypothetical protein FWB85_04460 [Chitinispirillia bacterium]|nr:hypothetical protein [Chitinispirillia bacterium]MCL2241820.1 hypothetical protein [Chitinispirillia bacterium]
MEENGIFRKNSIEKLSTPEQLSDCVQVIRPRLWYVLAGILAVVCAAGVWAFTGTIPERVQLRCVAFDGDGVWVKELYTYVPFTVSTRLSVGMPVQVSPDYAVREEFGYIYGEVANIGGRVVDERHLAGRYGNPSFVSAILPAASEGNFVEVRIDLEMEDAGGGLRWSNPKGAYIKLESGAFCTGVIVINEHRPYRLFIR